MPLANSESQVNCIVKRWKDHFIFQHAHFRTTSHSRWQGYAENPQYILNVREFFELLLVLLDDKCFEISACAPVQAAAAKRDRPNSTSIPSHDVSASAISTKNLDFRRECLQLNMMVVI